MHVANLKDIAIGDYTWMEIRDVLRSAYHFDNVLHGSQADLAFDLVCRKLKKHQDYKELLKNHKREMRFRYRRYLEGDPARVGTEAQVVFDAADEIFDKLILFLLEQGLIEEETTHNGKYLLTESGFGLIRQKVIRRISRHAAAIKLAKVLKEAMAFNQDASQGCFIQKIALFGSVLTGNTQDVGDIDIMVDVQARLGGLSRPEWRENEREILWRERPSLLAKDPYASRSPDAGKRLKRVSPYVSIEPYYSFDQFVEDGYPVALIFAVPPEADSPNPSAELACHYAAAQARDRLAQEIGCPELVSSLWDSEVAGR